MNAIVTHWPAILTALIIILPSVATGLSKYPKAKGLAAGLRALADRLSILSHHDAEGTFKRLGKRSRPHLPPRTFPAVPPAGGGR